jgi:hypothetical protein
LRAWSTRHPIPETVVPGYFETLSTPLVGRLAVVQISPAIAPSASEARAGANTTYFGKLRVVRRGLCRCRRPPVPVRTHSRPRPGQSTRRSARRPRRGEARCEADEADFRLLSWVHSQRGENAHAGTPEIDHDHFSSGARLGQRHAEQRFGGTRQSQNECGTLRRCPIRRGLRP